ncbi:DUF262 domain-containing protein [Adhaeribacter radiodurans]|uniref:DUF262 domain-containing protein n=1 Tax=Adhaeribacter radiodurans TaxID=2745197 RepID=A0A7L7LD14_9BACT|nr:DUF262 domain-containing protein [Adhaeribacter radiodurans]QMU30584.1 DUF262 domain-containing protein [Adhaeribacter radiodurans]
MAEEDFEEEILRDNQEIAEDIEEFNPADIVVYSRDWTIETICSQIKNGNIDLNPKFQRRNAWTDEKRSKLIESILIGYPIPEIVLAEDPKKKKSFIVIDGKQRLLTLAGFVEHEAYEYWVKPKLVLLKIRSDLNNVTYNDMESEASLSNELREFHNASLRCTIITNFKKNDILYDIFYRLNSGSVPLSTQELRQVLNRGEFSNYLVSVTDTKQPLHSVLNLEGPDKRLRDTEILLRLFAFCLYSSSYQGNLKKFLDEKMALINDNWAELNRDISQVYISINKSIEFLKILFGDYKKIGRKATADGFESRFNRVLFEVQIFYFSKMEANVINPENTFVNDFRRLCVGDPEFRSSIESTTKTIESYKIRYSKFESLINTSFGKEININPFK